jgi:hypothetical protein
MNPGLRPLLFTLFRLRALVLPQVAEIVQLLIHHNGFAPADIAVITPYVGQLRHLELELKRLGVRRNDLLLNTVDAFQGKECEVRYVGNPQFSLGSK